MKTFTENIKARRSVRTFDGRAVSDAVKEKLDMQSIDMGIALCHFALCAKENGIALRLVQDDPKLTDRPEAEYIASFVLE